MRAQDHVPLGNYSKDTAHVPVDTSFQACGYTVRQFHQLDSSNNEFCGLRLMVRVDVFGER